MRWAGREGTGAYFRIARITAPMNGGALPYDGRLRKIVASPRLWICGEEPAPVKSIAMEFVTPLRLRTGGNYNTAPDFVAVTHALLRRLHLLSAIYGGCAPDRSWLAPLMAQADTIRTESASFQMFRWIA